MAKRTLLTLAAAAFLLVAALSAGSASAASTCPTFTVLHNDSIGTVKIPAGQYTPSPKGVTCKNTATLIARFLNDYDGILPDGWVASSSGKTINFKKSGTSESIAMKLGAVTPSSNGAGADTNNGACPGTFSVLHNDRIGTLKLNKGAYKITTKGLFCWFDVSKLAYFLNYNESGKLPSPWTVVPAAKKVQRSPNHYFTLKYVGSSTGGNSIAGLVRCTKTLAVTTPGVLAGMQFPRASYYLNVGPGTTCASAGQLFDSWLAAGSVNNSWQVNSQTATFTNGSKKFQIEPTA